MSRLRGCEWAIRPVSVATAADMVARHHYARGGANTATFAHGLFNLLGQVSCRGVAWWIPPTRSAAEATWAGPFTEVLSLTRLVLEPETPKNAATFLLMRSVRLIRRDGRFRCLVTYADTWRGHTGFIYRVAGWEYLGLTAPEEVWVDPATGRMVARKAGPRTRTRAEMLKLGFQSQGKHPKHKFRLVLPEPRRRAAPELFTEVDGGQAGDGEAGQV